MANELYNKIINKRVKAILEKIRQIKKTSRNKTYGVTFEDYEKIETAILKELNSLKNVIEGVTDEEIGDVL